MTSRITRNNGFKIKKVKETHFKKLLALGAHNTNRVIADEVIFNFSDRSLNSEEKEILKCGLKFSLPPQKPKFIDHFLPSEMLLRNPTLVSRITGDAKTAFTSKVLTWAHESFNYKDTPQNNTKSFNTNILKNLKKD